jgi:hypothetical protein
MDFETFGTDWLPDRVGGALVSYLEGPGGGYRD